MLKLIPFGVAIVVSPELSIIKIAFPRRLNKSTSPIRFRLLGTASLVAATKAREERVGNLTFARLNLPSLSTFGVCERR